MAHLATPLILFRNPSKTVSRSKFVITMSMYTSPVNPHQFPFNPARIFLLPNGINRNDFEMIALHHYTSLKDLMPESPTSTASPTCSLGDSWREIPIKDPLVQHAAWAYLQPMTGERQNEDDHRWWRRFHHKVCWLLSCFNDVVLVVFEGWFPKQVRDRLLIEFGSDERERKSIKQGRCSNIATSF